MTCERLNLISRERVWLGRHNERLENIIIKVKLVSRFVKHRLWGCEMDWRCSRVVCSCGLFWAPFWSVELDCWGAVGLHIGAWSWTAELLRNCAYWSVELDCWGIVRIGAWSWTAELLRDCAYWSVELSCWGSVRIGAWSWTAELLRECAYWSVEFDYCTAEGLC